MDLITNYIFEGDENNVKEYFNSSFSDIVFIVSKYNTLSIDNARDIKSLFIEREETKNKIHIICADTIHTEAQNALLKVFEDKSENHICALVVKNRKELLPTLLSRFVFIDTSNEYSISSKSVKNFLSSDLKERLEFIEKFIKKQEDEENLKSLTSEFLDICVKILKDNNILNKEILNFYVEIKPLVNTRGASAKIILEYIAYTFPKITS